MKYIKAKRRDMYLGDMPLENIFINEFLPIAPGDFVKVYLYARLYAELGYPLDNAQMSKELAVDEKTIKIGFNFEETGAVAAYGTSEQKGAQLAVDEINAAGGIDGKQIEVVDKDNKSETAEAASVTTNLVTQSKYQQS